MNKKFLKAISKSNVNLDLKNLIDDHLDQFSAEQLSQLMRLLNNSTVYELANLKLQTITNNMLKSKL